LLGENSRLSKSRSREFRLRPSQVAHFTKKFLKRMLAPSTPTEIWIVYLSKLMTWLWRSLLTTLTSLIVVFSLVGNPLLLVGSSRLAQAAAQALVCDGTGCQLGNPAAPTASLAFVEDILQDTPEREGTDGEGSDRDGEGDPDTEIFSPAHEPLDPPQRPVRLAELVLNARGLSADRGTSLAVFRPPQI
jgi:hypothetical protein